MTLATKQPRPEARDEPEEAFTPPNFVSLNLQDGGHQCALQIHLDGEPQSWILLNSKQMDELIRLAVKARSGMR